MHIHIYIYTYIHTYIYIYIYICCFTVNIILCSFSSLMLSSMQLILSKRSLSKMLHLKHKEIFDARVVSLPEKE